MEKSKQNKVRVMENQDIATFLGHEFGTDKPVRDYFMWQNLMPAVKVVKEKFRQRAVEQAGVVTPKEKEMVMGVINPMAEIDQERLFNGLVEYARWYNAGLEDSEYGME